MRNFSRRASVCGACAAVVPAFDRRESPSQRPRSPDAPCRVEGSQSNDRKLFGPELVLAI
jgi:hypothetical protein